MSINVTTGGKMILPPDTIDPDAHPPCESLEACVCIAEPCPHCEAAEPTHYEVRIDDQLVGTCQGVDERGALIDFRPGSLGGR